MLQASELVSPGVAATQNNDGICWGKYFRHADSESRCYIRVPIPDRLVPDFTYKSIEGWIRNQHPWITLDASYLLPESCSIFSSDQLKFGAAWSIQILGETSPPKILRKRIGK